MLGKLRRWCGLCEGSGTFGTTPRTSLARHYSEDMAVVWKSNRFVHSGDLSDAHGVAHRSRGLCCVVLHRLLLLPHPDEGQRRVSGNVADGTARILREEKTRPRDVAGSPRQTIRLGLGAFQTGIRARRRLGRVVTR